MAGPGRVDPTVTHLLSTLLKITNKSATQTACFPPTPLQAQGVDPNLGVSRGTALQVPTVPAPGPGDRDPEDRTTR
jgi:hypothetical protein